MTQIFTGSKYRQSSLLIETLEDRILYDASPVVTIDTDESVGIGETVDVTVTFENDSATDTGYGPWIDVAIKTTGADGIADPNDPENPQTGDTDGVGPDMYDGFTLVTPPTFLDQELNFTVITIDDNANEGLGVLHPYAVDTSGNSIYVHTQSGPFMDLLAGYQTGDQLLVIELPFGSYTPGQPGAEVTFTLQLSDHADANTPLPIAAQGGFRYGNDPLNNPSTDPSIIGNTHVRHTDVDATLATLTKTFDGPEGETATGPNYERTYRIAVDIAEGQTLEDLNIFDQLSDYVQFIEISGSSHAYTVEGGLPSTTVPGGDLHIRFNDPIVGTSSTEDAWIEIKFYVPRLDANGQEILPEKLGTFINVENQAYGYGNWQPLDPRDPTIRVGLNVEVDPDINEDANPDLSTLGVAEDVFEAQSIAVQKNVEIVVDTGSTGPTPGDVLEYTIDFQISDYFAFGSIVITDQFSDGQEFLSTFTPTLSINGNNFTLIELGFDSSNFMVSDPHPTTGVTVVTFQISEEIIRRALEAGNAPELVDGVLLGGGVNRDDPTWQMQNDLRGPNAYNEGPTTGQIVFRTTILDSFRSAHNLPGQSREAALNQRDVLTNDVEIEAEVHNLEAGFSRTGNSVSDDSAAEVTIVEGNIRKEIYAINGVLTTDSTFDSLFRTGGSSTGTVNIRPGDTVTYRLVYEVPSGDVEKFRFADYLPLPVFDATELDSYDWSGGNGTPPPAGTIKYGPDHDMDQIANGVKLGNPTVTTDGDSNFFELLFGDADDQDNLPRTIDILFTVTVSEDPFADGMYLTNQALSGERSTQQPVTESNALAIVQVVLGQPILNIYKGVVASTQEGSVGTVGGVNFNDVSGNGFTGTLNGVDAAEAIGELDLLNGNLPDGGDIVRYAIVVQNTGRSDAFNVEFQDTIRGSFVNEYANASDFHTATNFRVYSGDGTLLTLGTDYTLTWDNATKEFQVELIDEVVPGSGAIGRGMDMSVNAEVTNGSNAIVVLYDLTVAEEANASSTVSNTAELTHYSSGETGRNHLEGGSLEDDANIRLASPTLVKQVKETSHNVDGNDDRQAVIGEIVTWEVTITVPEGTTGSLTLTDILDPGLGYLDMVDIVYSSGVTAGQTPANPTVTTVNGGLNNHLVFEFGDVVNSNTNNAQAETITITYRTVVLNTNTIPSAPGNQAGTQLNNSATLEWEWQDDTEAGDVGDNSIDAQGEVITVVEPALTIDKRVSENPGGSWVETLTNVDAGDNVYYQIVIGNMAAGSTHAYNVRLKDVLPDYLEDLSVYDVNGTGFDAADFDITLINGEMTLENVNPNGFTLEQGQTITIIVKGTLSLDVNPNQLITNEAEITWSSLPDTHEQPDPGLDPAYGERTGEDGEGGDSTVLNNYAASDDANVRITNPAPTKVVISTSEDHTSGNDVAIGEVVRYRIVLRVVEGTTEELVIRDNLPNGMQYLGNAKIGFVSLGDNVSSDNPALEGAGLYINGSSGSVVPTFDIPAALIDNNGTNGGDVFFNLGTITNDADSNAAHEYIVIEFNALVLNVQGNQHGTTLTNTVTVTQKGTNLHNNVGSATVEVVEPTLQVTKEVSEDISDAGDPIEYTITITNNSGVDAFNVTLQDLLPDSFHLNSGAASIEDLITDLARSSNDVAVTLANFALNSYDNSTPRTLSTTGSGFTLKDGESITLTLSGVVSTSVSPNEVIENEVEIQWTSLPDAGTVGNPTGSDTPGASGDQNGERNGSGSGSGPNDYVDDSEVATVAVNEITVTKHYHNSNDAGTSDANQQVTIGETVTYAIYVELPEGVVVEGGLIITDFVPVGMQYVGHQLVTTAAGSLDWNNNALLSDDFNGAISSADITVDYPGVGSNLTFTFGEITIDADNDIGNNAFVLLIDMQVLNVVGNTLGNELDNKAEYSISPDPQNPEDSEETNVVTVTVVEPELTVEKKLITPGSAFDEGDVVEYEITITAANGTHNSQANQVRLVDVLPSELTLDLAALQAALAAHPQLAIIADSSAGNTVDLLLSVLNPGETFTLRVQATVNTAIAGTTITNEAEIDWTSLISTDPNSGERNGSGDPSDPSDPNYYTGDDSADLLINVPSIIKSVVDTSEDYTTGTDVTIGEIITYEIVITIPEGETKDLVIADLAQANALGVLEIQQLVIHSSSSDLSWTGTPVVTYSDVLLGDGLNDQVTIDFGDVVNANTDNNVAETIVLRVTARVVNVAANASGDVLENVGRMTYTDGTYGNTVVDTAPVEVTVVEPDLAITKTIVGDVTNLDAGDSVTYEIRVGHTGSSTSDAFDLILSDDLPSELLGLSLVGATISNGLVSTNVVDRFDIVDGKLVMRDSAGNPLDLKQGETLIIQVRGEVRNDTNVGTIIRNEAVVVWSSLEGGLTGEDEGTSGERTGTADPNNPNDPNGYEDSDEVTVKTRGALAVSKTANKTNATIGEVVTYTIEITVAEGRTVIDLVDYLPDGMELLSDTLTLVAPGLTVNLSGLIVDPIGNTISGELIAVSNTTGLGNNGGVAQNTSFTLTYQAVVLNVSANSGLNDGTPTSQTRLDNEVEVSADLDGDPVTPKTVEEDDVRVTVVEPNLDVTKEIKGDATQLDAGDKLVYQIVVGHSTVSTANAYDLILSDTLPDELRNHQLDGAWIVVGNTRTDVSALLEIDNGVLKVKDPANAPLHLKLDETLEIEVSGIVKDDTLVGTVIENEVLLLWTSLEGGLKGDDAGGDKTERTGGGDPNDPTDPNNYRDDDDVEVKTRGALAVSKTANKTNATIGEIVEYTIEITVAEGRTLVDLLDNLPAGMEFIANSLKLGQNTSGLVITGLNANSLAQSLDIQTNFNGGTVRDGSSVEHNVTFTLVYEARVLNVIGNTGELGNQETLDNEVTVTADLDNDSNTPDAEDTDDVRVTVVEPRLEVEKEIVGDVTQLDAGDTLVYQITVGHSSASTADAYDLILNDELPEALRNYDLRSAIITSSGGSSVNVTAKLQITADNQGKYHLSVTDPAGNPLHLKQGEELVIEISGIVKDDTLVGTVIENEVLLLWTSMEDGLKGDDAGGRTTERTGVAGDPNDPTDPNNYRDDDDVDVKTRGALAVSKSANKTNATIGEVVEYTIEITVAEGRTLVDLLDNLPAGMEFIANSLKLGQNTAGLVITGLDANSLSQSLEIQTNFNGGTVRDGSSVEHNVTFTLVYEARVLNVIGNTGELGNQETLDNEVTVTADLDNDSNTPDAEDTDDVRVTVVEPRLEVEKEIVGDVTQLDAGDTLVYQITVGHSSASTADAYDLILSDELPEALRNYDLRSATLVLNGGATLDVKAKLQITTDNQGKYHLSVTDPAGNPLHLKQGEELVIQISGIVKDDTLVGTVIENEVLLLWTSMEDGLKGDDAGGRTTERTGVAGDPNDPIDPNNYRDDDDVDVKTRGALAVSKSANKTNATIGEVVEYTIEITVAEGRTLVDLQDNLPAGMEFIANSLKIGQNTAGLVITGLDTNSLSQSLEIQTNFDGGTVRDGSSVAHNVTFTLVYEARVLNVVDNTGAAGGQTNLENTVEVEADLDNDGTTNGPGEKQEDKADVDVVEPRLEVEKEIVGDVTQLDAGDTLVYQITVGHNSASTADAYDLILNDELPEALRNYNLRSAIITSSGGGSVNVTAKLQITADNQGKYHLSVTDPAGNPLHLKQGEELVITISGIVKDDTLVGTVIENEVLLLWTSMEDGLKGDDAGGRTTERTGVAGDPNDPTDPNNYRDDDDVDVKTRGALAVSKSANKTNATIGEIVEYTIEITVAEGRTLVDLLDNLPAGMEFIANSLKLGQNTAGLVITGLDANSLSQSLEIQTNFNGGTVRDDSSVAHNVTFTLVYEARVLNVIGNTGAAGGQTNLENTVEVEADLDNDGTTNGPGEKLEDKADVDVVEPRLEVEKEIVGDVTQLDAGDTLVYQITVGHSSASTADAYDLILNDELPEALRNYDLRSAIITSSGGGSVNVTAKLQITADNQGKYHLSVTDPAGNPLHLKQGEELVIEISGIVKDDTLVGTVIENEVLLLWTSLEGGLKGDDAGGRTTERTGVAGDPNDPTDPNNYRDDDDVDVKTRGALAVSKSANKTNATIGEVVEYTIEITVAEGRTLVDLLDNLPAGMEFIANSLKLGQNTAGLVITGLDANSLSQSLEIQTNFNGGTVRDDSSVAHNVTFTLVYEARVLNVIGNTGAAGGQTNLENTVEVEADLDNDGTTNGPGEKLEDKADVDVVEPRLVVDKSASKQDPHLGETITYTVVVTHTAASTSTAYDISITDVVPQDKLIDLSKIVITPTGNSVATIQGSSLTGWTIHVDKLEVGESIVITYDATVTDIPRDVLGDDGLFGTPDSDDSFVNDVDINWSSLPNTVVGERDGSGDENDPTDPNNYRENDDEKVTVVGADLALIKDDGISTVTPGDVWTYTLTITNNGTDTATGVVVTDVLHPELIFKSADFGGTYDAATRTVTWNLADIAVNGVVVITVEVELVPVVSAGLEFLDNTAEVKHDDIDPTSKDVDNPPYNDNEDPDRNVVNALPDLVVEKTEVLTNGVARNNSLLQYEITVTNVGNQDASDVILTDDFDEFLLSYLSSSHNGSFDGDLIVWSLGTIKGGGGKVTIIVEARVVGPVPDKVEEVANTAWATFDEDLSGKDPTPENNKDDHVITLKVAPDMVVVKSTTVDELGINEILLYTIEVTNAGPQNATNVVVVDNLPSEFVFVSASHGGVYDAATHTVTWNSATTPEFRLMLGQSLQKVTLELRVQLATGVAVIGNVTNVVRVTDDGTNGPDENPSNNDDDATVRVVGFTYDSFNNFSNRSIAATSESSLGGFGWSGKRELDWSLYSIETYADPILPLAPIYSGAAEPGSTLVIVLYNAKGEEVGRQSVVVDAGGNWMATFPGAVMKDYPQSVQISQVPSPVKTDDNYGYNMRPYYATALHAGHFFNEVMTVSRVASLTAEVVTESIYSVMNNPIGFEHGKHAYEFITTPGHPTGY